MNRLNERLEFYLVTSLLLIIFYGSIYIAGMMAGNDWGSLEIKFSWDMVNIKELKNIIGLD